MAQPTPYSRLQNLLTYATAHPSAPFNASYVDAELDAIETTLDAILANLVLIQRDDGYLKNGSVHADAFSTASLALIASDWTPLGLWLTATAYVVGDVVQESTSSYVCATAHTSGTFATDYAAGKWVILGATAATTASGITASAYGHIAATTVQGFLQELVDEKARIGGSTSQTFDISDATDDTHAVSAGQIQKSSLITSTGAGSADAITATISSGLTVLTDKMHVRIEATAANATTAPTFNLTLGSTATGAKTIKKGNAQALIAGDIAGAGHMLELVFDEGGDCWLLQNGAFPVGQSSSSVEADSVQNVGISFSVGSSALTASLKTASGGTPTSSDQVSAALRSSSASTGTFNTRTVSDALTLTVSSGSTLGHSSAVEGALHWYLIDNAGTLELAVSSKFHGYSGIVSTTAEGGAGAADSATVMYSTAARSSVPFVWFARTADTQTTAGTWAATPTTVSLVRNSVEIGNLTDDLSPDATADYVATLDATVGAPKRVLLNQLPLPAMSITGLTYANNGSDATNDIDIAVGSCRDSTNSDNLLLTAALTKRLDASWAVGTNQGGILSGAAANVDYYIWLIKRPDTGVVDVGFETTANATPTLPTDYTKYRLIGWFKRVGGTIVAFNTYELSGGGLEMKWSAPTLDVDLAGTLTTSRRTDAVKVPLSFSTLALLRVHVADSTTSQSTRICCPDEADAAVAGATAPGVTIITVSGDSASGRNAEIAVRTSATGTIAARSSLATVDQYDVATVGFQWARRNS
jgi:hypothetical protein